MCADILISFTFFLLCESELFGKDYIPTMQSKDHKHLEIPLLDYNLTVSLHIDLYTFFTKPCLPDIL